MIAQNYGRIVNIASIAGKEGNPNAAHYSASKAGVIALTKSLGKELAGYDIAVNAVTPAAAKTAIFDQITQEHIDFMLSKIPRNRFVQVEEVAALVAWIASERELLHHRRRVRHLRRPRDVLTGTTHNRALTRNLVLQAIAASADLHRRARTTCCSGWRSSCRHRPSCTDVGVPGPVEAVHVERPLQADQRTLDARQQEQRAEQRQRQPDRQVHPGRRRQARARATARRQR